MKKYKIIGGSIFLIILCLFFVRGCLINYHGSLLYFLGVSGEHSVGYVEAERFSSLSTDELLKIIENNRNFNAYPRSHYEGHKRLGRYIGAIKALGSKTDQKALNKLTDIIYSGNEGNKWDAISSIGRYKNKAMIPILCEALRRHTDNNTDRIIVEALIAIDDPTVHDCLAQEKNRIKWNDARQKAEKAIEKWSAQAK